MVGLNPGCSATISKAFSSTASAVFQSAKDCDLATNSDCGDLGPLVKSRGMTLPWLPPLFWKSRGSAAACSRAKQLSLPLSCWLQQDRRRLEPKIPVSWVSLCQETVSESTVLLVGLPVWCAYIEGRVLCWGYPGVKSLWVSSKVSGKGSKEKPA